MSHQNTRRSEGYKNNSTFLFLLQWVITSNRLLIIFPSFLISLTTIFILQTGTLDSNLSSLLSYTPHYSLLISHYHGFIIFRSTKLLINSNRIKFSLDLTIVQLDELQRQFLSYVENYYSLYSILTSLTSFRLLF